MEYSLDWNDRQVTLPKYSMQIAEKLESIEGAKMSGKRCKDKVRTLYDALTAIVGADEARELVGEYKECDPNEVVLICSKISDAYQAPLDEYGEELARAKIENYQIDRFVRLMESIDKLPAEFLKK